MLLQPQNSASDPPSLAILRLSLLTLDPNRVRGFSLADASRRRRLDAAADASACPKSGDGCGCARLGSCPRTHLVQILIHLTDQRQGARSILLSTD